MPIFSIVFILLLSCSVVTPPNLVVVVGGVTLTIRNIDFGSGKILNNMADR
jgi:hypothetical protein